MRSHFERPNASLSIFAAISIFVGAGTVGFGADGPSSLPGDAAFRGSALMLEDGATLAYYVRKGSGPTVVLIPSTFGRREAFVDPIFVGRLHPDFQLVVVELRGFGRSWPPPTAKTASIEQYATDVLQVVQHLHLDSWYVGGHSMGGMISIEIAGRHPNGLRGVIPMEGWPHSTAADAFRDRPTPGRNEHTIKERAAMLANRWTADEITILFGMWTKYESGVQILKETDYPFLTIWGDSMPTRPERSKLQLPDKTNIEMFWVNGSSHNVLALEFAGTVADAINEFIVRVEHERMLRPVSRK